jgi:hypothetical protein
LKYLIYHSLEGGQTIGETKVHHKWLKQASVCVKYCLPLVTLSDPNIIVSPAHVELGGVACTLEVMDYIVDQQEWVVILACDGIEGAVVLHRA